jgi:hypothetical protein
VRHPGIGCAAIKHSSFALVCRDLAALVIKPSEEIDGFGFAAVGFTLDLCEGFGVAILTQ